MDIEYYKEPFPHAIIDNFLPQELYDRIKTNIQRHRIGRSSLPEDKEIIKHLGNKLESIRNTVYPIHRDSPWKRLSTVLYIGKFNLGTLFHRSGEKNAEVVSSVEWKENRAMSFIPSATSYHSIRNIQPFCRDGVTVFLGSASAINTIRKMEVK